jgi:DNA-binding MarR family transcriptional regulator
MNAIELFRVARRLAKIGVRSFPESEFKSMPTSVRMVLIEVFENPDTTIGQIVERTGFPQSHVSAAVARLREGGMVTTKADPADGRRTLVAPATSSQQRLEQSREVLAPIDEELIAELIAQWGPAGADRVGELVAALEIIGRHLGNGQATRVATTKTAAHAESEAGKQSACSQEPVSC